MFTIFILPSTALPCDRLLSEPSRSRKEGDWPLLWLSLLMSSSFTLTDSLLSTLFKSKIYSKSRTAGSVDCLTTSSFQANSTLDIDFYFRLNLMFKNVELMYCTVLYYVLYSVQCIAWQFVCREERRDIPSVFSPLSPGRSICSKFSYKHSSQGTRQQLHNISQLTSC